MAKRTFFEKIGRINFLIFYHVIKFFSLSLSRRFLYIGLEDRSVYEGHFTDPSLNVRLWDKVIPSPLGIAAGFDNSFKYNDELVQCGFGFEEFGTFTQAPSSDHIKIRYAPKLKNIIVTQQTFGNKGIAFAQKQLIDRRHLPYVAGVSLALNVSQMDDKENTSFFMEVQQKLEQMTRQIAPYCDYIVINLSHPYLPFSSLVANVAILEETIVRLQTAISKAAPITKTRLLVKLPLNLNKTHLDLLADVFVRTKIDGLIIGGYMDIRALPAQLTGKKGTGYACGRALKDVSNRVISDFYQATKGQVPIIACGGVFTGEDAFEKISLGATLVQLHSAIIYKGPSVGNQISKKLVAILNEKGFNNIQEAVGSANKIIQEQPQIQPQPQPQQQPPIVNV